MDRLELRAWLRRRLKNPPLIDPACFTFGDTDIALILGPRANLPPPDMDEGDGG